MSELPRSTTDGELALAGRGRAPRVEAPRSPEVRRDFAGDERLREPVEEELEQLCNLP